jgi:hypothetical protein
MRSGYVHTANNHSGLGLAVVDDLIQRTKRKAARKKLEEFGFTWIKTSGVPQDQRWNIDNWPLKSLENAIRAYHEYGQVIVDLHNTKKLYPENTEHYVSVREIVEQELENRNGGSSGDDSGSGNNTGGNNTGGNGSQNQQPVQAGTGQYPEWMVPVGVVTVTGVSLFLILSS